jgi:hypothetical protein
MNQKLIVSQSLSIELRVWQPRFGKGLVFSSLLRFAGSFLPWNSLHYLLQYSELLLDRTAIGRLNPHQLCKPWISIVQKPMKGQKAAEQSPPSR